MTKLRVVDEWEDQVVGVREAQRYLLILEVRIESSGWEWGEVRLRGPAFRMPACESGRDYQQLG